MNDLPIMAHGDDVVRALVHAGFRIAESTGAHVLLERYWLLVLVPRSPCIGGVPLQRILRSASIPPLTFLNHLAFVRCHQAGVVLASRAPGRPFLAEQLVESRRLD